MTDDQTTTSAEASPDHQTYTFNWQQLDDVPGTDEEFLKWMLVNLVNLVTRTSEEVEAGADRRDLLDQLRAASDDFTSVSLSIRANGIELNVPYFVSSVRHIMRDWAREEAARRLGEVTDFSDLREKVEAFRRAMLNQAQTVATALGVELDEDGGW